MITSEIKEKIDNLWNLFAINGLENPLDIVEQISYLMFIHDLDETESVMANNSKGIFSGEVTINNRRIDGEQLKWSVFSRFSAVPMYSVVQELVFPFIKNINNYENNSFLKHMDDVVFKIPNAVVFSEIVDLLNDIYNAMKKSHHVKNIYGNVYEYLLSKITSANFSKGQFKTPKNITKMIIEMIEPKHIDIICDPACGTGDFLLACGEYIKKNTNYYPKTLVTGFDNDKTITRIAMMNLITHGFDGFSTEHIDSLSDQNSDEEKYSLILSNPPFKGSLNSNMVSAELLKVCKTKKTELLFLAKILRMLKIGGRGVVIVPQGALASSTKAHKDIRKEIIENHCLEAVISISSGSFKPYTDVLAGILIFKKTNCGGTDKVWFYNMKSDESDIPDIINKFKNLENIKENEQNEKYFFISKDEIMNNGYDLSFDNYPKNVGTQKTYQSNEELSTDIKVLENLIVKGLKELNELSYSSIEENQFAEFAEKLQKIKKEVQNGLDKLEFLYSQRIKNNI